MRIRQGDNKRSQLKYTGGQVRHLTSRGWLLLLTTAQPQPTFWWHVIKFFAHFYAVLNFCVILSLFHTILPLSWMCFAYLFCLHIYFSSIWSIFNQLYAFSLSILTHMNIIGDSNSHEYFLVNTTNQRRALVGGVLTVIYYLYKFRTVFTSNVYCLYLLSL